MSAKTNPESANGQTDRPAKSIARHRPRTALHIWQAIVAGMGLVTLWKPAGPIEPLITPDDPDAFETAVRGHVDPGVFATGGGRSAIV